MANKSATTCRRYKIGDHPAYDKTYDEHKFSSTILRGQTKSIEESGVVYQLQTLEGLRKLHERWSNRLANDEKVFDSIEKEFHQYRQRLVNEGGKPPDQMPPHLVEKKLRAEALYDLTKLEITTLNKYIYQFEETEKKSNDDVVLKRGCVGALKIRGGIVSAVDGQNCEIDPEGTPRIRDSRSPYDSMHVRDYISHVVHPWKKECARLLKERQERAHQENQPLCTIKKERPPLPAWPEGVKKY